MFFKPTLVLVLICCVAVREDFPFLISYVFRSCPGSVPIHSDNEEPDSDVAFVSEDDPELPDDSASTDQDGFPSEESEMPVILEGDLDLQADEVLSPADHKAQFRLIDQCLLHEDIMSSFASVTSFCTLKRLRT